MLGLTAPPQDGGEQRDYGGECSPPSGSVRGGACSPPSSPRGGGSNRGEQKGTTGGSTICAAGGNFLGLGINKAIFTCAELDLKIVHMNQLS